MSKLAIVLVAITSTLAFAGGPPKKAVPPPKGKGGTGKTTKTTTPPDQGSGSDTTPPPTDTKPDADASKVTPPPADNAIPTTPPPGGDTKQVADKPAEPPAATGNEPDVDTLRQEYLALRDELFKSRARANAIASQLYSTKISIKLTYTTGRYYNPTKVAIRLDGASVYDNTDGAIAKDDGVRFDGYIAPGRHVVTYRIEATGKDDDSFTSMTETQLVVKAVPGKDLVVAGRGHDSGDISYNWKKEEKGSYSLGIDTSVKTVANAAPKGGK